MSAVYSVDELVKIIETTQAQLKLPGHPALLYSPMRYILDLGGKRLRPLLVLMSYNLFNNDPEQIAMPALSVELFHNFSLIHDDIMDKAPVRRGKPTVHKKWDENVAILSGDGMLVKAYELLENVDDAILPKVLKDFNKTAIEVCEGQQLDMDFELRSLEIDPVTEAEYLEMIRLKTSVLFGFSLKLGALLAGQELNTANNLYEAGVHLGLAFQLQDDLLDLYGGEKFGKVPGGDIINAKKTYLLVKTLELASQQDSLIIVESLNNKEISSSEKIERIKDLYGQYNIPDITMKEIKLHLNNFEKTVQSIGNNRSKTLTEFVRGLAHRSV